MNEDLMKAYTKFAKDLNVEAKFTLFDKNFLIEVYNHNKELQRERVEMKENIIMILRTIEIRENIRILFAVESGSRAWGIESKDSDYDVRFVYIRPKDDYLKLNKMADVITDSYNEHMERAPQEGCLIDIEGFDIYKYLRMLSSSNPTAIEWLKSDVVYINEGPSELRQYIEQNANPVSLYHHYKSMCKQNYIKYIKSRNKLTYKKYLYAMRGLLNAKYVAINHKIPNVYFIETINELLKSKEIPSTVLFQLRDIIKLKKQGNEKNIEETIPNFDLYIENELKDNSDCPDNIRSKSIKELDIYLIKELK